MFTTIQKEENALRLFVFLKKNITRRVRRRFHEANIVGVPCKRAQNCCATLRRSQNNRNVGTCWAKSLTSFKLYATSANKCQHCCGSMQTDATSHNIVGPNNVGCCWPGMLGPFASAFMSVRMGIFVAASTCSTVITNTCGTVLIFFSGYLYF